MAEPTDDNLRRARKLVEETPNELQRSDRIDLCQDITKALSDAEQRGREAGMAEVRCKASFGSKSCAMVAGHSCAHTSMSGSSWPILALLDDKKETT